MADVTVTPQAPGRFEVEVPDDNTVREHVVTMPESLAQELGLDDVEPVEIVRATFLFLLDREPPSAILREFSLSDVPKYFPEFYQELAASFGR